MKFESELEKGNFIISECDSCKKVIWPPSEICNNCFGDVKWRKISRLGNLLEFSKKDNNLFGIAEFEGSVRIIGKIQSQGSQPNVGQHVRLENCTVKDGKYAFEMSLC